LHAKKSDDDARDDDDGGSQPLRTSQPTGGSTLLPCTFFELQQMPPVGWEVHGLSHNSNRSFLSDSFGDYFVFILSFLVDSTFVQQ
jgi:hypothetical protein